MRKSKPLKDSSIEVEVWDDCTYQEKQNIREEFTFWFDKWFGIKESPLKSKSPIFLYNKYLNPSRRDNHGIPGTD